jgi:WD40 repeat protein
MKLRLFLPLLLVCVPVHAEEQDYFPAVAKLIEDRCLDCHSADDPDGNFVMERHEDIMRGGESGVVLKPGRSVDSLLVRYLRGEVVKDGKKKFMPPGKRDKLTAEEVEVFAKWIDAGAKPPQRSMVKKVVEVPKVAPKAAPRVAVTALAFSPQAKLVAVGRHGVVDLVARGSQVVAVKLEGHRGPVNALVWSPDGARLFAASGEGAVEGEVKEWDVAARRVVRTMRGHRDTIFAMALSPDGQTLATGSYDQKIKLWNVADGTERRTLGGHNGAVFGLAFRPDGRILASASADRTVKLWDVSSGERRDTLSQPLKEQFAVAWSADGRRLAAAGADNRIRVWEVSQDAKETTNPLLIARFAHEQPILRLVWSEDGDSMLSSAQDGLVKIWDAKEVKERARIDKQPDWPTALAFAGEALVAGRADGTLAFYNVKTGKAMSPPKTGARGPHGRVPRVALCAAPMKKEAKKPAASAPAVDSIAPRGVRRGGVVEVQLTGRNLPPVISATCPDPKVRVFTGKPTATSVPLMISTPADLPRGTQPIVMTGGDGKEIGRVALRFDDVPVFDLAGDSKPHVLKSLPATVWATLANAGETARFEFDARAGQTVVFDCQAKAAGSKVDAVLRLLDATGHVLAASNDFDGSGDPFVAHKFSAAGRYAIVVGDALMAGGPDRFFALTVGELPFVVGVFPSVVQAGAQTDVDLVGYNLPADAGARKVRVTAGPSGSVPVKLDAAKFRSRGTLALVVSQEPAAVSSGDNHTPATAQPLSVPVSVSGRFLTAGVADYYRFDARKGVTYVVETEAARRGSPVDTNIAVLRPDGQPVERLLLQAVRDSAITFRPIDSTTPDARVDNWREMELNELMWMQGEVVKIFRMPEGPDSGFQFYSGGGKRRAYFDTSATAHALDEPCYIVEPHPPGTRLTPNGLPAFTVRYENDDDCERELGSDSRLLFTAPADAAFVVRVRDSRGFAGERFIYRLIVREARPDFAVRVTGFGGSVNVGSGAPFALTADRKDGFDGDITCEISGLPAGWHVTTPLVIEAGHLDARGCLTAFPGAAPWTAVKIVARATVGGREVTHAAAEFGTVKLEKEPPLVIALQAATEGDKAPAFQLADPVKPVELTIAPGEIVPAWLVVKRNTAKGAIRFDVENLPHGVVVDNLGLNGITLLEGQDAGEIFIKAASWVKPTDRLAFAVSRDSGKQASLPILLRVRDQEKRSRIINVR